MSDSAAVHSGLQTWGQGTSAATVLTNRGETITVIDRYNDIYREKHSVDVTTKRSRGARPMHKTTLRLGDQSQTGKEPHRSIKSTVGDLVRPGCNGNMPADPLG